MSPDVRTRGGVVRLCILVITLAAIAVGYFRLEDTVVRLNEQTKINKAQTAQIAEEAKNRCIVIRALVGATGAGTGGAGTNTGPPTPVTLPEDADPEVRRVVQSVLDQVASNSARSRENLLAVTDLYLPTEC